jgi:hypothetical protein
MFQIPFTGLPFLLKRASVNCHYSKIFQNPFCPFVTAFCLAIVYKMQNYFGGKKHWGLSLGQFLPHCLSRKAEGNGPMMPWQPVALHAAK